MSEFQPFADDTAVLSVAGLDVENGRDRISLHGALQITRDAAGLEAAKALLGLLTDVVGVLSREPALPRRVAPAAVSPTRSVRNPFG